VKTSRLLHDLELARICPLPEAEKRIELKKLRESWPPYTYQAFRKTIPDNLNVETPLAPLSRMPWEVIELAIRHWAKSPDEIAANLRVASALYHFACDYEIAGKKHEFYPLVVSLTEKLSVSYWSSVIISIDKRPVVPFFDPRKSNKLTPLGRKFALSAMNERIRALESDFADVRLAVFQFSNPETGPRVAKPYYADELDRLFDYKELLAMVRETYTIWNEILKERKEEGREKDKEEFRLKPTPEPRRRRRS
jgi:hypothetical protein